jgi:hypothetical protein
MRAGGASEALINMRQASMNVNQDYWASNIIRYQELAKKSGNQLEDLQKRFPGMTSDFLAGGTSPYSAAGNINEVGGEYNAGIENKIKSGGGLGTAKVINMYFQQPLIKIDADNVDSKDIGDYGDKVIEVLLAEINNISSADGMI